MAAVCKEVSKGSNGLQKTAVSTKGFSREEPRHQGKETQGRGLHASTPMCCRLTKEPGVCGISRYLSCCRDITKKIAGSPCQVPLLTLRTNGFPKSVSITGVSETQAVYCQV